MAARSSFVSIAAVVLVVGGCSAPRDARGEACGYPNERYLAQFEMARASDYRKHLPRMGRSPELEHDRPAFVVVFPGPIHVAHFGGVPPLDADGNVVEQPARDPRVWNVVCVVVNGSATIYTDVELTGLSAPLSP